VELTLPLAFTVGIFSTLHCVGMCGGIIGTLSMSLAPSIQQNRSKLAVFVLLYSLGRISSYALAGFVLSVLGGELFRHLSPEYGHDILTWISSVLLGLIGLYLAGWLPSLNRLEKLGQPLWRQVEPLGRRLLPVSTLPQAYVFGSIWGWLPCGLVYTTLIWAASAGSGLDGALMMIAFGLGTLPTVLTVGMLSAGLVRVFRMPLVRRIVGVVMIGLAVISVWYESHVHSVHIHHS